MYKHFGTHWQNGLADTASYVHRCNSQQGRRKMVLLWGVFMHRLMTDMRLFEINYSRSACITFVGLYGNVLPIPSWKSKISLGVWIKTAWEGISSESVINRLKNCCLSNGTDRMEDILWEEDDDAGN
jgi:hypothetical protein